MFLPRRISLTFSILVCHLLRAQGADKFTDGNRPYEFGFKVDGQQHRHEEKDKEGIIMGEFGFVTADDVYHVTVYATDKEGRFKILSMKNIHLKASSTSTKTSARQGHSLSAPPAAAAVPPPPPPSPALPQGPPVPPPRKSFTAVSLEPPGKSCSSCSIPTSTTPAPRPPAYNPTQFNAPQNLQSLAPSQQNSGYGAQANYPAQHSSGPQGQNYPQQFGGGQTYPELQSRFGGSQSNSLGPGAPEGQNYPQQYSEQQQNYPYHNGSPPSYSNTQNAGSPPSGSNGYAPQPGYAGETQSSPGGQYPSAPYPQVNSQAPAGSPNRNPKQYTGAGPQFGSNAAPTYLQGPAAPPKPTLLSAQMQIVDKNTDIHHLNPGEKEGLPEGLSKHDMVRLLYTFNYTLGFQGHFEEGYTNGVKKGYYFVTGRNGVRTRVDYVADDTGFHPKLSQDVLDLLSDDVPKPETERDAKYGLKGYEFKWLYYPVDSKRR